MAYTLAPCRVVVVYASLDLDRDRIPSWSVLRPPGRLVFELWAYLAHSSCLESRFSFWVVWLFICSLFPPFLSPGGGTSTQEHGTGAVVYPDGQTYEGDFRHGLPHGVGQQSMPSGESYEVCLPAFSRHRLCKCP